VPINDFAIAHEAFKDKEMDVYYPCCGKTICRGCVHSFEGSVNDEKCPFCNSDRSSKTEEENNEDNMKRVEANDAASIYLLANFYYQGLYGMLQDQTKGVDLYTKAAELGSSKAHNELGVIYHERGDMKKAKFHFEAAAMAGHEGARYNRGIIEYNSGNIERAVKHWKIAASAGEYHSMNNLLTLLKKGYVSQESIDSTLMAYNNSCAEFRSEARDACIRAMLETD
jgi:TPR repeat protein